MALYWEAFSQCRLTVGPGKMSQLQELKQGPEIAAKLNTAIATNVLTVKWVKHYGTEYRPGLIVCVEVAEEMPVFCKIRTIIVKDEQVILAGSSIETICFDEHYNAFRIMLKAMQAIKVFNVQDLLYFKPLDIQMAYGPTDASLFIVSYCHLMQP